VADGQPSNSYLNMVVFDPVRGYNPDALRAKPRKRLRATRAHQLRVVRFDAPDAFVEEAYPVYLSFYERTHYRFPFARTDRTVFDAWARALFRAPKVAVLGSYHGDQLLSVEISCLVGDILVLKESINSGVALQQHAPDFMLDWQRTQAAGHGDVAMIWGGYFGRKDSVNRFKLERGARVLALPAFLHMHPLLVGTLKAVNRAVYDRLKGLDETQLSGRASSIDR
jgi:hypothetical protein